METTYPSGILSSVRETSTVVAEESAAALAGRVLERRGRAWILEAPVGMGAAALATSAGELLRAQGLEVLTATALRGLQHVPLGALVPSLVRATPDAGVDETPDRRLLRLFARLARGTVRTVLVVEDAMWLDEASAAAIHQLVRAYGVRVVLTTRPGEELTDPLRRLDDEGLVERVAVAALDDSAASAWVQECAGGPLTPESLLAVVERGAGNPLFLRLLVEAAQRSDLARPTARGIDLGVADLPPRIAQLVTDWVAAVAPTDRVTLELLAAAHRLPRGRLDASALARLHARGLVALEAGIARIASPLVAETLIRALDPDDRDARRTQAAVLLDGPGDDDRFARLVLLAETRHAPATADVAWAAHAATWRGRHALAVHLAERADALAVDRGEARPDEALILRGESLWLLGRHAEADAAFDEALSAHTDDAGIAFAASRASSYWAIRRQDPARAARIEQAALDSIGTPDARAFLLASTSKWRIMLGEVAQAPVVVAPIAGSEAAVAAATLDPALVATLAGVRAGRPEDVRRAIAAGRPFADAAAPLVRHAGELFDYAETLLIALDGDIEAALRQMSARTTRHISEGAGIWSYGRAFMAYQAGRFDESLA